jgi:hypothetical protein
MAAGVASGCGWESGSMAPVRGGPGAGTTRDLLTMGESLADSQRAPSVRELRNVSRPVLDAEGKVVPPERHAGLGPACPTAWRL